jgi:hypothetical protein
MSLSGMFEIPRLQAKSSSSCRRTPASRFVFGSSSRTARIPAGVYPERRRRAGMTGTRVDFQSTNSEPLGLEPRIVQLHWLRMIPAYALSRRNS